MSEIDYSSIRSVADEEHWREFVVQYGGELVEDFIKTQGVKNADFLFRKQKVLAELKVLETEFLENPNLQTKIEKVFSDHRSSNRDDESATTLTRHLTSILRDPLKRIIKKANRQIRETKQTLGLLGYRGVIILVNDNFRGLRPHIVMGLCGNALAGTQFSSCDGLIYQTNHLVELPDNPYANLLWAPMYDDKAEEDLVEFVNDLGREWRKYSEAKEGPYDYNEESEYVDLTKSHVVTGPYRMERYDGDK